MNNNDERDYAEEEYNKGLLRNPDDLDKPIYSDEERESNTWWNFGHSTRNSDKEYDPANWGDGTQWGVISESAQEVEDRYELRDLPKDGTLRPYRTEQTQTFILGHSGHVNVSWHIFNNVNEMYDESEQRDKSYTMPALDGSTLYVWASLHMTDEAAHAWAGSATGQFDKYAQFNTIWL
jgi:hypothetical protein